MAVHEMNIRVRFGELDPYNHVNHAVYISYFEAARVELLMEAGYSLGQMRGTMSLDRCPDPRAFERANYIQVLHHWSGFTGPGRTPA